MTVNRLWPQCTGSVISRLRSAFASSTSAQPAIGASKSTIIPRVTAFLAALLMTAAMTVSADAAVAKPNVVVILLDDVGYGDLGSYNGTIATPNIDALAAEGMRFTDFHSNGAVCTPTRAALMTGRYPQRAGLEGALLANTPAGLKQTEITLAEVLKNAGYRSGIVGKWHLGDAPQFNPTTQGFSLFYGFLTGEIDYVNHLDTLGDLDWWKNKTLIRGNEYSTTAITREANGFIQRNASRPFFLYVAYQTAHDPYQAPGDAPIRTPGQPKGVLEGDAAHYPQMIQAADRGIRDIRAKLKSLGLEEKTLILVLSDNGAPELWDKLVAAPGSNGPLRGGKNNLYEGGHRVPAIAFWKGTIGTAVRADTLATIDVFPTILELAGVASPAGHVIDGVSFAPLLLRKEPPSPRKLFRRSLNGDKAVRNANWKLLVTKTQTSLFDLSTDLGETSNVAGSHAAIVDAMKNSLQLWLADVSRKVP